MFDFDEAKSRIEEYVVTAKSREEHDEVHTTPQMIEMMMDHASDSKFQDSNEIFLDPAAGIGNFPLHIAERLVENGISYEHAMEEQIYMIELQPKNCVKIEEILNPTAQLNLNLKCCDALELDVENMRPADWKLERFRTDYGNQYTFFSYEPTDEELERLEEIRELTDNDEIIEKFENGYV